MGIAFGQFELIQVHAESIIPPLLIAMLYVTFLQIPLKDIQNAFKNIRFTLSSIIINFVWVPLLAWLLALSFLGDNSALYIGFIMLMVTPCTDWYLIFTKIARGNVALSTAILPLNLILQLILMPVYLFVFAGTHDMIEFSFLLESIVLVLLTPFILSLISKALLKGKPMLHENLLSMSANVPIVFLCLAIAAMFASQGQVLIANVELIGDILLPIILFFIINFIISQIIGHRMKFAYAERTSLSLTTLARNSPIALAIALTAFPHEPLIALTLVIGPLLELPILAITSQGLLSFKK